MAEKRRNKESRWLLIYIPVLKIVCNSKDIRSKVCDCGTVELVCVFGALHFERGRGGALHTEGGF